MTLNPMFPMFRAKTNHGERCNACVCISSACSILIIRVSVGALGRGHSNLLPDWPTAGCQYLPADPEACSRSPPGRRHVTRRLPGVASPPAAQQLTSSVQLSRQTWLGGGSVAALRWLSIHLSSITVRSHVHSPLSCYVD